MPPLTRTTRAPARTAPAKEEVSHLTISARALESYRAKLEIDKSILDDVWVAHAGLVDDVGNQYALAQSYRDAAEAAANEAVAQADGMVRSKLKLEKPTESDIKARVALDPDVQNAQGIYREWKLLSAQWGALVKAFDSRQYALRSMSSLWEKGYWADNHHRTLPASVGDRVAARVRGGGTSA